MSRIKEHLHSCIEKGIFPGAAYVVGTSKGIIDRGVVGSKGIDCGPVTEDTLYDLASMTKPLVAIAFMKLLEEGKVCLDDQIRDYLPEYKEAPRSNASMYELLTHTSSIPGQVQLYRTCHSKQEMIEAILYLPLRERTKTPVMYSSQGFIILGEIMERIENKSLDLILKEKVFEPLNMQNTLFIPSEDLMERIAPTEDCPWRGHMVRGQVHDENAVVLGGICGHAGLFATAEDLARVGQAMLSGLTVEGTRFLFDSTIQLMTKNHTSGMNLARGLGWQGKDPYESPAGDLFGEKSFGHTGFTGTSLWVDPDKDLYAVLLTNRVHPSRNGVGMARARHIFHNLAVCEWETKKTLIKNS